MQDIFEWGVAMKRSSGILLNIFLILFGFTAVFFSFEGNQKLLVSLLDDLTGGEKEFVEMSYFMGDDLTYHNGRYFSWDGERISYLDHNSATLWSRTFLFDEPNLKIEGGRIAVFNKEGEIYVYNSEGKEVFTIDMEDKIFDARILDGDVGVHLKNDKGETIIVYGPDGTEKLRNEYSDEIPLGYWKDEKGELKFSVIDTADGEILSKLYSENEQEPIFSVVDELILKTFSYGNGSIILTDEGIKLFKSNEIKWERDFPLIKDVAVDGTDIYVLYGDNLEVLDKTGQTIKKLTNPIEYRGLHNHGRYVIMYGNRDIEALRDGEIICSNSTGGRIKGLTSQFNDLIITMEEGVSVMRIKDAEKKDQEDEQ